MDVNTLFGGGLGVAIIAFGAKLIVARIIAKVQADYEEKITNAVRDAITDTKVNMLIELRKEDNARNEKKCN